MTLERSPKLGLGRPIPESVGERRQKIQIVFAQLGVSECPSKVMNHLFVLEQNSDFNEASRNTRRGFDNILAAEAGKEQYKFRLSPEDIRNGSLAALIHDIGKSSSSEDLNCQVSVVKLFSVKNIPDPNMTVAQALKTYLKDEKKHMLSNLLKVGVKPDMTMRAFWDKHTFWTKEILDEFPGVFNENTRIIAASHHINQGINPYDIKSSFTQEGKNTISPQVDYCIRVLMAIDKYEAKLTRDNVKHAQAMKYLRDTFAEQIQSRRDTVMASIIDTIDRLGKKDALFSAKK